MKALCRPPVPAVTGPHPCIGTTPGGSAPAIGSSDVTPADKNIADGNGQRRRCRTFSTARRDSIVETPARDLALRTQIVPWVCREPSAVVRDDVVRVEVEIRDEHDLTAACGPIRLADDDSLSHEQRPGPPVSGHPPSSRPRERPSGAARVAERTVLGCERSRAAWRRNRLARTAGPAALTCGWLRAQCSSRSAARPTVRNLMGCRTRLQRPMRHHAMARIGDRKP